MSSRPAIVLGRTADVAPVACRLALGREPAVVLCLRSEEPPVSVPVPGRRRSRDLAARLASEGLDARARGALVIVEAGPGSPPAPALAQRLEAACGAPPVVALLRPRTDEDEALLDFSDVVLAEGVRDSAARLLADELAGRGLRFEVESRNPGMVDLLAGAGLRTWLMGGDSGQASVEAVALMPLLLAVVLAIGQLLAAGVARELAGNAATAGAAALIQGRSSAQAARRALPGWSEGRALVTVTGRQVVVKLRPPGVPVLAELLEARATADAGPAP